MSVPIIRFMGAFGKAPTLKASLDFELARTDEVAATSGDVADDIGHAGVALIFKKSAIIRKNKGDVWSIYGEDGRLQATRKAVKTHREFWVKAGRKNISGLVVTREISRKAFEECRYFCAENDLPMFVVGKKGNYRQVVLPQYQA